MQFTSFVLAIIVGILLLMTVELAGFLGVAGIKMNPVSAVTIITAVGIGKLCLFSGLKIK